MGDKENIEDNSFFGRAKKFSKEMTKFRRENPVTRNGGGEAPGKDAEVPGANDQKLERAPSATYGEAGGNTNHERRPKGGEEK